MTLQANPIADFIRTAREQVLERGERLTQAQILQALQTGDDRLEDALARFMGFPSALVFSTGYHANVSVVQTLVDDDTLVVSALAAVAAAAAKGIRIGCFRPPSTPDGVSRLRLTAHAQHGSDELAHATDVLRRIVA